MDWNDLILRISRFGPSGVRRSLESIRDRILEELAELRTEAVKFRQGEARPADVFAEAVDVWYYTVLAEANGADRDWVEVWRAALRHVLQDAFGPGAASRYYRLLPQGVVVKYGLRFVANRRRKDQGAERALLHTLAVTGRVPPQLLAVVRQAAMTVPQEVRHE